MKTRCSLLWAVALALLVAPGAAADPFRLTIGDDQLLASGAAAQARVVFFGISREISPDDVAMIRSHAEVLADTDGDGQVTFPLGQAVPVRSMWVAVDLSAGAFDAAAPEGFRLRRVNWRGQGPQRRPEGRDVIQETRPFAEVLVVRPGAGVWRLRLGDGSRFDADGAPDGQLEAALEEMQPLADSPPPPQTFLKDDVVLLMDPDAMELVLVKVGDPPQPNS